jgi:ectoine hydroxylase-related dioxygenase (phytanoyl-CoA dioxygenase family)
LSSICELSKDAASELRERGFVVLRGSFSPERIQQLAIAYNVAVESATVDDVHIGSASTRVADFVNRGPEFDDLYIFPPLLEACGFVIGRPFKLSSFHSRTLRPHTPAEELHVDVEHDSADSPLLSFILMVDEFRSDNGATRFVPGSHLWSSIPASVSEVRADHPQQGLACGPAGSLIIFNGSVWHGHTANTSSGPRRSLQGAFIPRDGCAGTDFADRMQSQTLERLGPLAKQVLAI